MRILKGTDGSVVSIRRDDRTSFEGLESKRSEEAVTNLGRCRRVGAKVSDGTVTVRDCWLLQSSNRNDKFSTRRDGPITRAQAEGAKMQGGSCVKTARRELLQLQVKMLNACFRLNWRPGVSNGG
ncbi:hypothetical protein K439DRAFT_514972 [Ramaria rubella]|nr:hypothetical protein K439DRAFT_514972 [Ramaria rubella]